MENMFGIKPESALQKMIGSQEKMLHGIETLMNIDYEKDMASTPKELVFEQDKMKLYHYIPKAKKLNKTPLLVTYALVNKQYMMDIQPGKSVIEKLLEGGQDIYIIDWGYPTAEDKYLTMEDYINGYIDTCVDIIRERNKVEKINLLGICQGGVFSFIYTALHQEKIKNLVSMVTPMDFHCHDITLFKWGSDLNPAKMVQAFGNVPGEFMNAGFVLLKPFDLLVDKYVSILDIMDDEEALGNFLRMEHWIFDSPDQAGACFQQFVQNMFVENNLYKGKFYLGGELVDLKKVTCPTIVLLGTKDNQVPPNSTRVIPDVIGSKDVELHEIETGHIGLFVGGKSQREVAPKINEFLTKRDK